MNDNGYVYVLMNPSMENLVKIGKSTRDPKDRAKELSSTTGVPTPFVVVYDCYFENCTQAEVYVHTFLESKGFRVSKSREFFEIPIKDAIDAVMKTQEHFGEFIPNDDNLIDDEESLFSSDTEDDSLSDFDYMEKTTELWEDMFEIAETYYYGFGDEIQDFEEAMNYYLQAIKLGSIEAYCKIGIMYNLGEGVRENKNKAFQYFKEGAKKGDTNCYAEMAMLFGEQENIENGYKSWKRYFELTKEDISFLHGASYIQFVIENDLKLEYIDKLIIVKNDILKFFTDVIDKSYGTEFEVIIPRYKKAIRFIKSNLIDTSERADSVETPKPKSKWKKLFG